MPGMSSSSAWVATHKSLADDLGRNGEWPERTGAVRRHAALACHHDDLVRLKRTCRWFLPEAKGKDTRGGVQRMSAGPAELHRATHTWR